MSETIETVGKMLPKNSAQEKDAIHVAVVSVVSDEDWLRPGQEINLVHGTSDRACAARGADYGDSGLGVVDPFLANHPRKGDRFWMFLRPGTVTSLRHHWTHPAIDSPAVVEGEAERWLRDFARRWHFDYDEMIDTATCGEDYIIAHGRDLHGREELGQDHARFWMMVESLTGKKFDDMHRGSVGWGCSC